MLHNVIIDHAMSRAATDNTKRARRSLHERIRFKCSRRHLKISLITRNVRASLFRMLLIPGQEIDREPTVEHQAEAVCLNFNKLSD